MPCNDWGNSRCDGTCNSAELKTLRERNDKLAQMLCSVCRNLMNGGTYFQTRNRISEVPGLEKWWIEHQEHDRKREERERHVLKN